MEDIYNKGFRSVYRLTAHIVFVTKYRRPVINKAVMVRLKEIFAATLDKWKCQLIEFDGEADHVHLLVDYPPQVQLSKPPTRLEVTSRRHAAVHSALIANLKTVSSRLIRKEFESHIRQFHKKPVLWTGSYFVASCGGVTIEQLKRYVQNQNTPPANSPHR